MNDLMEDKKWTIDEWEGCYPSNWRGVIIPEAIAHPAKFSSRLIRRIYEHMIGEGWLHEGDTVIDPFGGVALGALDAMRLGLRWRGVELEARFFELGNKNIAHWNAKFGTMPRWSGDAVLLNGDSRKLLQVLAERAQGAVSSPPYADSDQNYKEGWKRFHDHHEPLWTNDSQREAEYGSSEGQLSAMRADGFDAAVSSPPYADSVNQSDGANDGDARLERKAHAGVDNSKAVTRGGPNSVLNQAQVYGSTEGQLGAMKGNGFDVALSSPPYADGAQHTGGNDPHPEKMQGGIFHGVGLQGAVSSPPYSEARIGQESGQEHCGRGDQYGESDGQLGAMKSDGFDAAISSPPFRQSEGGTPEPKEGGSIDKALYARHAAGNSAAEGYGATEGQLANMGEGDFDVAVSSPPYEDSVNSGKGGIDWEKAGRSDRLTTKAVGIQGANDREERYGVTEGQLGADSGDDFWLAARTIVEQVFLALEPGGHAVWVCKDFVKNKARVPFSDQWRQLCEAVGFVTLHEHYAMLVHHKSTSITLEGDHVENKTESKSFFRRLAEKKGSPKINWETVWCMVKPMEVK